MLVGKQSYQLKGIAINQNKKYCMPSLLQLVASYLNGQYWGLYNIREKVNEHFLASKANVDPSTRKPT